MTCTGCTRVATLPTPSTVVMAVPVSKSAVGRELKWLDDAPSAAHTGIKQALTAICTMRCAPIDQSINQSIK